MRRAQRCGQEAPVAPGKSREASHRGAARQYGAMVAKLRHMTFCETGVLMNLTAGASEVYIQHWPLVDQLRPSFIFLTFLLSFTVAFVGRFAKGGYEAMRDDHIPCAPPDIDAFL